MICAPAQLPELFAETPVPSGPISAEAADAIARLLWAVGEGGQSDQADVESPILSPPTKSPVALPRAPG
jgi:hypothetical protein